jgi:hypothetical protein
VKAGRYDITIEQGTGFELPLSYTAAGTLVDFTGCKARLQVRPKVGSAIRLINLTTENGGIVFGSTGQLKLVMSATATSRLTFSRAVYDLEIVPSAAEPYRLLEGSVFLNREVTR